MLMEWKKQRKVKILFPDDDCEEPVEWCVINYYTFFLFVSYTVFSST